MNYSENIVYQAIGTLKIGKFDISALFFRGVSSDYYLVCFEDFCEACKIQDQQQEDEWQKLKNTNQENVEIDGNLLRVSNSGKTLVFYRNRPALRWFINQQKQKEDDHQCAN